jgi:hypothetical protein
MCSRAWPTLTEKLWSLVQFLAHGKITVTGLRSGVVPVVAGGRALGVVIYGPLTGNLLPD